MFISEEQLKERLANPDNLANFFKERRKNAAISESRISEISSSETTDNGTQRDESENSEKSGSSVHKSSIQHREIKRPGNNRAWLSKQERTGIATDLASAPLNGNKNGHKIGQKEIAEKYGVQVSTVSDIANGVRRVPDSPRSVEQEKVDLALDAVREQAIDRLMAGLGQLTEDKISGHTAKDISVICANMSKVVKDTIPQEKAAQQINLVVYTPELRAEKHFDSIEV